MTNNSVADHYTHGNLLGAIRDGMEQLGKSPETVTIDDLGPIDEFHIGGRQASRDFLSQLELTAETHVLDVGCGLGGASRFTASTFGSRITGIDLTMEFVETGQTLCNWVGLEQQISLQQGSALDMPFENATFDAAFMMHVGMNIADKNGLFREVAKALKPGGLFGVYDVMQTGEGDLVYPVPWAATDETSAVDAPARYRAALEGAGFAVTAERNRRDFALAFFAELSAKAAQSGGPPPLGLHVLMGETRAEKVKNMVHNISTGLIAPVEIIARKPD